MPRLIKVTITHQLLSLTTHMEIPDTSLNILIETVEAMGGRCQPHSFDYPCRLIGTNGTVIDAVSETWDGITGQVVAVNSVPPAFEIGSVHTDFIPEWFSKFEGTVE